ncbi:MAG TPA: UDP-N-acetylglucosamine 2-epimerase (non-hydrolyzing) [Gemmatimonadales bacterium]|nr:UDP-N-acetylglucosamine 2-epimerase (non-hydrolyzing) [Gemmatimonadales bacterium]
MRAVSVVGARPNFMKLAPVHRALAGRGGVEHLVVHTGQHYDAVMSDAFFQELGLPEPDHHLGVGSGSHAAQTAAVMQRLEPVLESRRPDLVLVYGDVNSTLAAALVASKLGLQVGHVEAGLRSGDWSMPEEINRVVTDRLSVWLFAPSRDAVENLLHEGLPRERLHFVGNVMIDSLVAMLPAARALDAPARHGVAPGAYVVATLHRPANVDDPATLRSLLGALEALGRNTPVVFPTHPRTQERIRSLGFAPAATSDLRLMPPLGYLETLGLVASAGLVITDSGGLQEETTYLGVPCLTVRPNTERPITCRLGTNRLVAARRDAILAAARDGADVRARPRIPLERWDGRAAERIAQAICEGRRFE